MATNIGPRLQVEGEDEYRAAINGLINQGKALDAQMRSLATTFATGDQAEKNAAKSSQLLTERIQVQKDRIAQLQKGLDDAKAKYGENSTQANKWQVALSDAETELHKLEAQARDTGEAVEDEGKSAEKASKDHSGLINALKAGAVAFGTFAVAAAGAAVSLAKNVISSFAELEQNVGGSVAVFGDYADEMQTAANDAYKNMGTSASDYLATANKMGALFQGSGLDQARSMDLTTQAMQRAADMASVMGIDVSDALQAVSGAAKGNYTMMDNIGVAMNATTLEAYRLEKGINTAFSSMSNAEKAELAMQYFFENTQQYAGNFANEASTTISGSIGMLTASVQSFVAGLGQSNADIGALTANMVTSLMAVIDNVVPVIQNIVAVVPQVAATLMPALMDLAPTLLDTVTQLFTACLEMLIELTPDLVDPAINMIITIVNTLIDNLPQIIDAAIQIIVALINGLINALPQLAAKVPEIIATIVRVLVENFPQIVTAGINLIGALIGAIAGMAAKLWQMFTDFIKTNILEPLRGETGTMGEIGSNLIQGLWNGILGAGQWLWQQIQGFAANVINSFKAAFGVHSPSKKTEWLGEMLGEGLANGIEDMQGAVNNAWGTLTGGIGSYSGTVELAGGAVGATVINVYEQPGENTNDLVNKINRALGGRI